MCLCVFMHVRIYVFTYICMDVYVYVCVDGYMYVCIIYKFVHIESLRMTGYFSILQNLASVG